MDVLELTKEISIFGNLLKSFEKLLGFADRTHEGENHVVRSGRIVRDDGRL